MGTGSRRNRRGIENELKELSHQEQQDRAEICLQGSVHFHQEAEQPHSIIRESSLPKVLREFCEEWGCVGGNAIFER